MKKVFMLLMFVFMVGMTVFSQEVIPTEKVGLLARLGLDAGSLVAIGLMIFATLFASAYVIVKTKLREAAKLLLMVADAIEDKKIDIFKHVIPF